MAARTRRARSEITQSTHRPRRRHGVRGLRNPFMLLIIGTACIVASLIDSQQNLAGLIVGAAIIALGLLLMARRLPGIGQWRAPRARVRSTPEGVVFEGEVADVTVPWDEYQGLVPEWHGSTLLVWLVRSGGQRFPVPTLSRRGLITEGARSRALAEVQRVSAELATRRGSAGERVGDQAG